VTAAGAAQDYLFNVHGVGTDASTITHDSAVTLRVVDFALGTPSPASVSAQQGSMSGGISFLVSGAGAFSGTVTLACPASGMPVGVTCSFSPSASVSALPATVTLTFATTASTPVATTPITISATTPGAPAAKTQSVSLSVTVPAADYTLAISNSPLSAPANQTATFNGTLKALNGYASAVNLTCGAGAPPTCTISPTSVTPTAGGVAFTATVKSGVAQTYNFGVNGTGTDGAHVAHTAPVVFNSLFTLTISDSSGQQTVRAGQSATYSLVITPVGATTFPLAVNFTCSGLPAGATCSAPPVTVGASGTQNVTLTISTSGLGNAAIRPSAENRRPWAPFFLWVSAVGMAIGGLARKSSRKAAGAVLAVVMASTIVLSSCGGGSSGGGGGGGGGGGVTVSVSPRTASKFPTEQQPFTASVSGNANTAVTWQVNGVTGGNATAGTIDANGVYTAPGVVPSPNNPVMVTAVSQADVTKSGSATVTLKAPTPAGTYTVTITATAGSVVQTATATLVVQ
jgi:hypothetical protein